jgi:hypothetical protein
MPDEEKSPADQLVDLLVYAPVGIAMTVLEQLPDLIAKGRERVTGQTAMARMIGEFGVKQAGKEARRRIDDVTELLADLGVFPGARNVPAPPPPAAPQPSANGRAAPQPEPAAPAEPRPDGSALAIPGYDTLSASQVVQRLAGLSPVELEAVRAYEAATRGRRTILSKISQLQSSAS